MSSLFATQPAPYPQPAPRTDGAIPIRTDGPTLRRDEETFWIGRVSRFGAACSEMQWTKEDLVLLRNLIDAELGK